MWATITRPFAWLMLQLYEWTGKASTLCPAVSGL